MSKSRSSLIYRYTNKVLEHYITVLIEVQKKVFVLLKHFNKHDTSYHCISIGNNPNILLATD